MAYWGIPASHLFAFRYLVGAVGIETPSLLHKDLHGNDLVSSPRFKLLLNVVKPNQIMCAKFWTPTSIQAALLSNRLYPEKFVQVFVVNDLFILSVLVN